MTLYRPAESLADRAFVISTWSSSYKNAHTAGLIASEDWAGVMHAQIAKLIDRPGTRTIVAYDRPSFLYGFICGDTRDRIPVVHYVYVKAAYRAQQVAPEGEPERWEGHRQARGLFAALGVDPAATFLYTCKTSDVADLHLANKIPLARFRPQAARYANYQSHEERDR